MESYEGAQEEAVVGGEKDDHALKNFVVVEDVEEGEEGFQAFDSKRHSFKPENYVESVRNIN